MERLAEGPTSARVLILTENDSRAELLATLRLGVPGYGNLRRLAPEELCAGVLAVAVHGAWMCPVSVAHLIALVALQPHGQPVRLSYVDVLSEREQQVLRLVASGTGDRQVAATLCLSENTVKTYIGRIREKLDVPTRHDAVRRAIQLGLVPDRRFNTA
jgi:DNA-binding NarL/FixJ family response regulator